MIDKSTAGIDKFIVHLVGNKSNDEGYVLSDSMNETDENLSQLLLEYFLKPFIGKDDVYHFIHSSNISMNEVFNCSKNIFENEDFIEQSKNILIHLYEKSTHPKITMGNLFVVLFSDLKYNNELVKAIGIFKSERKETFLRTSKNKNNILLKSELGISTKQIDKGCLIINSNENDGYRIFYIDTNRYDTKYWIDDFLRIEDLRSDNYNTKNYLSLCKKFGDEYIQDNFDQKEKVAFMKKSLDYFNKNEKFDAKDFSKNVIGDTKMSHEFNRFKKNYAEENNLDDLEDFDISQSAVKNMKRRFKNYIKLDTNIELKINFNNIESSLEFVEKGFDRDKDMYYYKVFFNKEVN